MARDKRIAQLMTWHRRVGLFMVAVLAVVITTGFLMNHSDQLGLEDIKLTNSALLRWYGLEREQNPLGFQVEPAYWLVEANGKLFLNNQAVAECPGSLLSALNFRQLHLALCQGALLLIDQKGTLLETITTALGLPVAANRLGLAADSLVIETVQGVVQFDIDSLSTLPLGPSTVIWPAARPLPEQLALKLDPTSISAEKLVQDIHSGRIFGPVGILLVDLSAVLLVVLTITGLWSWLRHEKLHHRKD